VQGTAVVQACRRTMVPTRGSRPAGGHRIVSGKRRPLVDTNRGHRRATRRLGEADWNAKAQPSLDGNRASYGLAGAKAAEKYDLSFFATFAASAFNRDVVRNSAHFTR